MKTKEKKIEMAMPNLAHQIKSDLFKSIVKTKKLTAEEYLKLNEKQEDEYIKMIDKAYLDLNPKRRSNKWEQSNKKH